MTVGDRIMALAVVRSGSPFRPNDVRNKLGMSSSYAADVCRQLVSEGRLIAEEGRYRRASMAQDWLTNRGGCWPVPSVARVSSFRPRAR